MEKIPGHTNRMLGRHGEDVFDKKGIQFHHLGARTTKLSNKTLPVFAAKARIYLPHEYELNDGDEPHVTGVGVQPPSLTNMR